MSIKNITNSDYIIKHRENTESIINNQYTLDKTNIEIVLDSNDEPTKYIAHVETYKCIDSEKHYWSYMKLKIFDDKEFIIEMNRNYYSLPYCYVKQGENEFIITSENYQCITIINLHIKNINTYGNIEDLKCGGGFCPIEIDWYQDSNELKINGCVWGGEYKNMWTTIVDLNNPDFNTAEYISEPIDDYEEDDDD